MGVFKDVFKQLRTQQNLTQDQLASKLKISRSTVSMYERGEREPEFEMLETIADYFNVDTDYLVGRSNTPNKYAALSKHYIQSIKGLNDIEYQACDTADNDIVPFTPGQRIPIYGCVPAGYPAVANEYIEGYDFADVTNPDDYFYLRVKGDSMINANIFNGDLVLVQKQNVAENGQIIVCLINGDEATLKRFHQQGDMVVLQPENPTYQPIIVPCKDFNAGFARILGIAREVKRKL